MRFSVTKVGLLLESVDQLAAVFVCLVNVVRGALDFMGCTSTVFVWIGDVPVLSLGKGHRLWRGDSLIVARVSICGTDKCARPLVVLLLFWDLRVATGGQKWSLRLLLLSSSRSRAKIIENEPTIDFLIILCVHVNVSPHIDSALLGISSVRNSIIEEVCRELTFLFDVRHGVVFLCSRMNLTSRH